MNDAVTETITASPRNDAAPTVGEYLLAMSHEIRAPLNAVIGMSSLLLDGELTEKHRQYAKSVHSAGESLAAVLNDLIDLSRVAADRLAIEPIPFDLRSMVEETASVLSPRANERGLVLRVDWRPELPRHVVGDPGRARQVLGNLVGHAVNGTSQGEVVIRVLPAGDRAGVPLIRFVVEDTGIGIMPERLSHVFERYVPVDASPYRSFGVTGLGLRLSADLVRRMGGEIGAESEIGKGSRFWFVLPMPSAPASDALDLDRRAVGGRMLIVEPDPAAEGRYRGQIEASGWSVDFVEEASRLADVLRAAANDGRPYQACIISDYAVRPLHVDLATRLKAEPALARIALVMVTAVGSPGEGKKLWHAGFAAYLRKPVPNEEMRDALAALFDLGADGRGISLITRHSLAEVRNAQTFAPDGIDEMLASLSPATDDVAEDEIAEPRLEPVAELAPTPPAAAPVVVPIFGAIQWPARPVAVAVVDRTEAISAIETAVVTSAVVETAAVEAAVVETAVVETAVNVDPAAMVLTTPTIEPAPVVEPAAGAETAQIVNAETAQVVSAPATETAPVVETVAAVEEPPAELPTLALLAPAPASVALEQQPVANPEPTSTDAIVADFTSIDTEMVEPALQLLATIEDPIAEPAPKAAEFIVEPVDTIEDLLSDPERLATPEDPTMSIERDAEWSAPVAEFEAVDGLDRVDLHIADGLDLATLDDVVPPGETIGEPDVLAQATAAAAAPAPESVDQPMEVPPVEVLPLDAPAAPEATGTDLPELSIPLMAPQLLHEDPDPIEVIEPETAVLPLAELNTLNLVEPAPAQAEPAATPVKGTIEVLEEVPHLDVIGPEFLDLFGRGGGFFVQHVVATCLRDVPLAITDLATSCARADIAGIRAAASAVTTAVGPIGAAKLLDVVARLTADIDADRLDAATGQVGAVEHAFLELRQALDAAAPTGLPAEVPPVGGSFVDQLSANREGPARLLSLKLADSFLADGATQMADLATAVRAGQADQAQRVAQTLKGMCGLIGADSLGKLCALAEADARLKRVSQAARYLPYLDREFERVRAALTRARG